jgi:hypothetical protein
MVIEEKAMFNCLVIFPNVQREIFTRKVMFASGAGIMVVNMTRYPRKNIFQPGRIVKPPPPKLAYVVTEGKKEM